MNKNLCFSIIACVLLFSCNDNFTESEESNLNSNVTEAVPTSRIVSIEQAKTFAEKAMNAIQTKGDTVVVKNSVERSVEEVIPIAFSGETVLYIVNFTDNHGYMILCADKEVSHSVLSFDTKGKFDISKIEIGSTVWVWLETEKEEIFENLSSGIHKDHSGYQLWEYIIENNDGEITVEIGNIDEIDNSNIKPSLRGTHPNSSERSSIAPWSDIRYNLWGQGQGYNANAPSTAYPIGCPAVAIGLLCKTHQYPSGYNYPSMPTSLNTSSSNAISQMFRDIANKIPGYTWTTSASGATPSNILIGLRNVGYTSAKMKTYDAWTAYSNIKDWYPILLGAYQNQYSGGHIWIADGYYEQMWKYTQKKKFLGIVISTKTWYEYMDTFYMNWGWDGNGNGWVDQENWSSSFGGSYNSDRKLFYDLYPN